MKANSNEDIPIETRESTSPQVARNAIYNSGAWGVIVLITLIATPYIVHKLTVLVYGIYALLTGLIGYYSLMDLGLGQGVIKYVSQYQIVGNYDAINKAIDAALWVQISVGILASSAIVIFTNPILSLLNIDPEHIIEASFGLRAISIGLFITMISGTLGSIIMGLERYDITSKINVISNALLTLSIVVILYFGRGLQEVIIAHIIVALFVCLSYAVIVKKILPQWRLSLRFNRYHFMELFRFSGYIFISKIASVFNHYIIRFIIAAIVGPAAVTYYTVPMKIINAIGGFIGNLANVLFPFASSHGDSKHANYLKNVYLGASRLVMALALPAYVVIAYFSKQILGAWMGFEFAAQSWVVLSFLAGAFLLSALTMVPVNFALGLGHSRLIAGFSALVVFVGIIIVIPLTKTFGIQGTAGGLLFGNCLSVILVVYVTRNLIDVQLQMLFRDFLRFHCWALTLTISLFITLKNFLHIDSTFILLIVIVILIGTYYLIYVFHDRALRRKLDKLFRGLFRGHVPSNGQ